MSAVDPSATDIVVGAISGLAWDALVPWVTSLRRSGFRGRTLILHVGGDERTVAELKREGIETFDAGQLHRPELSLLPPHPLDEHISVNRFFYLWHYFTAVAADAPRRYIIATDVRDVVFQTNPSEWLERNLGAKRLLVGGESLRLEDEPWGSKTMRVCFGPLVWEQLRARPIYNAGTFAGEFRTVVDLCLQVYLLAPGDRVSYSDQAALNLLLSSAAYVALTRFASSEDGWACQAGTTADPRVVGQFRPRLLGPEPCFDGVSVRTRSGKLFALVHQYDRVPEWAAFFRKKFS